MYVYIIYIYIYIHITHVYAICTSRWYVNKLCQNSVSGWGPLEKRRCFPMICPVAWIR